MTSPDGKLTLVVSDDAGLRYRVEIDGKPLLADSVLGLAFADGTTLGPAAKIADTQTANRKATWDNPLGQRRTVADRFRELRINLREGSSPAARLPRRPCLRRRRRLPLRPARSVRPRRIHPAHANSPSSVSPPTTARGRATNRPAPENTYREGKALRHPPTIARRRNAGQPFRSVLPLLVETPAAYVAVAEIRPPRLGRTLPHRHRRNRRARRARPAPGQRGAVVGRVPMLSPWRVLMVGRTAADLVTNDLVATLATPSRIADASSWVKPGMSAWDPWWTGVHPPTQHTGLEARGDTRSHHEYIDFAAEMGWPYQLVDWHWYQHSPCRDKSLFPRAQQSLRRLHPVRPRRRPARLGGYGRAKTSASSSGATPSISRTSGIEKTLEHLASARRRRREDRLHQQRRPGSRPVVRQRARGRRPPPPHGELPRRLQTHRPRPHLSEFHHPGGRSRQRIQQTRRQHDARHFLTLPFTRGLLGPMDYTPGGFLNRTPYNFKATKPAQVMGTRARQLAMTVVYPSPPASSSATVPPTTADKPGVEFFRDLPTVWDESVVLSAEVGKHLVIARRSGQRWFIAAMNGDDALTLDVPLAALGT